MAWEDRSYHRDDPPPIRLGIPAPTPMSLWVMGACLAVFLLVNVLGMRWLAERGLLTFIGGKALYEPWRWITYQYLHGGGAHIFWNLLGLYFFLPPLERVWGWKKALAFYTVGAVVAGATFGLMCLFYPFAGLLGASGGVLAALGACAYLFPEMTFLGLIPIRIAAALYGVLFLLTIAGDKDGSDAAHLGGLVFGFVAPMYGRRLWAWADIDRRMRRRRVERARLTEQNETEMVDRILLKVHESGMNSLNWRERRALRRATERQRSAETARVRRAV